MYGDPDRIRDLARAFEGQATTLRDDAGALVARATATEWTGAGAETMRARARNRAGDLRRTATLHDEAATALRRHADEVAERQALIARAEAVVRSLLADGALAMGDPAGDLQAGLPVPGSLGWLALRLPELPGLPDLPDLPLPPPWIGWAA